MLGTTIDVYRRIEALHSLFNYIPKRKYLTTSELGYILGLKKGAVLNLLKEMRKQFPLENDKLKGWRYDPKQKPYIYESDVAELVSKMAFWERAIARVEREERIMRDKDSKRRHRQIKSLKQTLIFNNK